MQKMLHFWLEFGDLKSLGALWELSGSSLGALWELSGSSLGALWELVTIVHITDQFP